MTFTISAKQPDVANMFSAIKVIAEEATLSAEKDSLSFRGMDPSHVVLVDMSFPRSCFETFKVSESINFGIKVEEALKCVNRFDKKDSVTLTLTDSLLTIKSASTTFDLRLIESTLSKQSLPKLDLDVKIRANREIFNNALMDIATIADHCRFEAKKDGLTLVGKGDNADAFVRLIVDEHDGEGKATYGLDFLTKMIKAVSIEDVQLAFSTGKPLKVTLGYVRYYLAPRVVD